MRHPNVIAVHVAGELFGQHYFVMDFVEGESLADRLAKQRFSPEECARIVRDVARAVEHLHTLGIVHRDLKPGNIILDSKGEPYLTDFGMAKFLEADTALTQSGCIIGTLCYMAPEQAASRHAEVGPRSDIYGLGAILYEMLTGRTIVSPSDPLDALVQILEREPEPLCNLAPKVPPDLDHIGMRCLQKTPHERYPAAAALADDLERFLKGDDIEARAPGTVDCLWRWARRGPALASHWAGLGIYLLVDWINFWPIGNGDLSFHLQVSAILSIWAGACFVFHRLSRARPSLSPVIWVVSDAIFLTTLLLVGDGVTSPVVLCYPVLVVASGLWFHVHLIWYQATLSVVSYAMLVADSCLFRPQLRMPVQHHIAFAATRLVTSFIVAYQVKRLVALNRYHSRRGSR
ncbi:MAG: serine/threonine-protein kinase [Planctomycetota bacterium]